MLKIEAKGISADPGVSSIKGDAVNIIAISPKEMRWAMLIAEHLKLFGALKWKNGRGDLFVRTKYRCEISYEGRLLAAHSACKIFQSLGVIVQGYPLLPTKSAHKFSWESRR